MYQCQSRWPFTRRMHKTGHVTILRGIYVVSRVQFRYAINFFTSRRHWLLSLALLRLTCWAEAGVEHTDGRASNNKTQKWQNGFFVQVLRVTGHFEGWWKTKDWKRAGKVENLRLHLYLETFALLGQFRNFTVTKNDLSASRYDL